MLALIQRVSRASVTVTGEVVAKIGPGLMVLLGIVDGDTNKDAEYIANKLAGLRIFPGEEENQEFHLSVKDIKGEILLVSQFTLAGNCQKGRRPSFSLAMNPGDALPLYEYTASLLEEEVPTQKGIFGAHMEVELINDGPVTLMIDSKK